MRSGTRLESQTMARTDTPLFNFIARGGTPNEWRMVLLESGPWTGAAEDHLRALQNRLYACIDAALVGRIAEKFPESKGKRLVIQVDCYNVPRADIESFFQTFSAGVFEAGGYKGAATSTAYVSSIGFALTFNSIH